MLPPVFHVGGLFPALLLAFISLTSDSEQARGGESDPTADDEGGTDEVGCVFLEDGVHAMYPIA